jgi:hypothetical protein
LKLLTETIMKIVVSVDVISMDRVLCFGYSDGSVEYRDLRTMTEMRDLGSMKEISHLTQIGFSLDDDEACKLTLNNLVWVELITFQRHTNDAISKWCFGRQTRTRWQTTVEMVQAN